MNMYDFACVFAALLILATAVARLNDIRKSQTSKRWWVRRLGLLMVSVSMVMFIASYFTVAAPYWADALQIIGFYGFLLTWMTTPGMPPWWKYVSRNDSPDANHGRRAEDV